MSGTTAAQPLTAAASPKDTVIFGFDSAWADNAPGAICALPLDAYGHASFEPPALVRFEDALEFINTRRNFARVVVALDQPTIVPNETGMRPVERVATSLLSRTKGGVQPAYRGRNKAYMFGDDAPIWKFKKALAADDDPRRARSRDSGRFLVEVFPALALAGLHAPFACRAPKYNPEKRNFRLVDWEAVVDVTAATAKSLGLSDCEQWCSTVSTKASTKAKPDKSEQDRLDAAICALIGFVWIACGPFASMMLGDLESGYIVTPVSAETRRKLEAAAAQKGVPYFCVPF